jgi:hypothetical protein
VSDKEMKSHMIRHEDYNVQHHIRSMTGRSPFYMSGIAFIKLENFNLYSKCMHHIQRIVSGIIQTFISEHIM